MARSSLWQNSFNEQFNSILRGELLNGKLLYSIKETPFILDNYKDTYHTKRPHSSIGYRVHCTEVVLKNA